MKVLRIKFFFLSRYIHPSISPLQKMEDGFTRQETSIEVVLKENVIFEHSFPVQFRTLAKMVTLIHLCSPHQQ